MKSLLLLWLIAIPNGSGTENMAGRTVTNLVGYDDALLTITQSYNPGAGSGGPGLAAFPAASSTVAYLFDAASDECVYGSLQLSHSYSEGTALKCHMHWAPTSTHNGTVAWQIDYTLAGIAGTFAAAGPLYVSQAGGGTANAHQIASFADIACATCTISSIMQVRVCRDANDTGGGGDTYNADAAGLYFDCHYLMNSVGSATPTAK